MNMADRRARCQVLYRKYYANVPTRDTIMDATVRPLLGPSTTLLDAGCGSTAALLAEFGKDIAFGVGMDYESPAQPPGPHTAILRGDLEASPFPDRTFDVECLYPDRRVPIPLGDLESALPICNSCVAPHTFRPDED